MQAKAIRRNKRKHRRRITSNYDIEGERTFDENAYRQRMFALEKEKEKNKVKHD